MKDHKIINIKWLLLFLLFFATGLSAQESKEKQDSKTEQVSKEEQVSKTAQQDSKTAQKARAYFESKNYVKATEYCNELLQEDARNVLALYILANIAYERANYRASASYYRLVDSLAKDKMTDEDQWRYVQTLMTIKDFENADIKYQKIPNKKEVFYRKQDDHQLTLIRGIKQHGVSNYGPFFHKDTLFFVSDRKTSLRQDDDRYKDLWTGKAYTDIHYALASDGYKKINPFNKEITIGYYALGRMAKTADGNTVYFSKSKINQSNKRANHQLYMMKRRSSGKWQSPKKLAINTDDASYANPAISADGKQLYFASDVAGGQGNSDIYVADILSDGELDKVTNLGANINTSGRDNYPFVTADNKLYFASDGYLGYGGLDIYHVDLKSGDKKIINLGKPINSNYDDTGFVAIPNKELFFLASNKSKLGNSIDNIYVGDSVPKINPADLVANLFRHLEERGDKAAILEAEIGDYNHDIVKDINDFSDRPTLDKIRVILSYIGKEADALAKFTNNKKLDSLKDDSKTDAVIESSKGLVNGEVTKMHAIISNFRRDFEKYGLSSDQLKSGDDKFKNFLLSIYGDLVTLRRDVYNMATHLMKIKQRGGFVNGKISDLGGLLSELHKELEEIRKRFAKVTEKSEKYKTDYIDDLLSDKTVYFNFDGVGIKKDQMNKLNELKGLLEKYKECDLLIEGHTDERGSLRYNFKLAERRALMVKTFLIHTIKLPAERIKGIKSYGETKTLATCKGLRDCSKVHAKNRRVVFKAVLRKQKRR